MAKKRDYPQLTDEQRTMVEENMGLVYQAVRDLFKGVYEYEDLVQVGSLGLCLAAIGYRQDFGVSFATFASTCIRKQILRHNQIWSKKKRNLSMESYSLDEMLRSATDTFGVTHKDLLVSSQNVEDEALADALMDAVMSLPNKRQREVLLRHMSGYTLNDIGHEMGVTRSRAGQLLLAARESVMRRVGA